MKISLKVQMWAFVTVLSLSCNVFADEISDKKLQMQSLDKVLADKVQTQKDLNQEINELQKKAGQYNDKFAGINFGVGMALTFKHGKDRIDNASIEGGVVRVNKEHNRQPKLMLETHYFFKPKESIGIGPFLGIEPDSTGGNVIGSYALGVMLGLKREGETKSSWNIGVGYIVNTNVKVLGDGIEEGSPLPTGETNIRYKEVNQPGWLIMAAFSW